MLYISLFLSAVLLVAANWAARYAKQPVHTTIAWSVVVAFWQCVVFSPAVMLQVTVLCGGLLIARAFGRGARFITPISLLSVVIAYGVTGYFAVEEQRKREELRARFPFESME